jgi:hypothetical protein
LFYVQFCISVAQQIITMHFTPCTDCFSTGWQAQMKGIEEEEFVRDLVEQRHEVLVSGFV